MKEGCGYTWNTKRIYGLEHIWIDIMLWIPLLGFANISTFRYLELNFAMGRWCCLDGVEVGTCYVEYRGNEFRHAILNMD